MKKNLALLMGPSSIALWIAGIAVAHGMVTKLPSHASDAAVLAWVQGNKNPIIVGCWLFMTGCLTFLVFAGALRSRLATAEGGQHSIANVAFGAAVAATVFGIAMQTDLVTAIDTEGSISAATAGAMHHLGDMGFVGAELALIVLLGSVAVLAFRTAIVPRWWGVVGAIVAVALWIGPIGWAALLFAFPLWIIGTTVLLARGPRQRLAVSAATA